MCAYLLTLHTCLLRSCMMWSQTCWSDMLISSHASNHACAWGYDAICYFVVFLEIVHFTLLTAARMSKSSGTFCNSSALSCTLCVCTCNSKISFWMICAVKNVLLAWKRHASLLRGQRHMTFLFVVLIAGHWRHRCVGSIQRQTHWKHLLFVILQSINLFWQRNAMLVFSLITWRPDLFSCWLLHLQLRRCWWLPNMMYACVMHSCMLDYIIKHAYGVQTPKWSICLCTHLWSCVSTCYTLVGCPVAVPCWLCFLLLKSTAGCCVCLAKLLMAFKRHKYLLLDNIGYSMFPDLFFFP